MKKIPFFPALFLPLLLLIISCQKDARNEIMDERPLVSSQDQALAAGGSVNKAPESELLKSLRAATARFNSTTQAINAGHEPDDHCVSVPGVGGMGYHWVNRALVDPVFDPLKPEALLYATGPGGNLRLVAVEYIVLNTGQARPMFDSQLFDIGGAPLPVAHWTLHVWVHEHNPSGTFAKFNPNISCP